MAEESLKNKTVKGVYWSGVERFSVQLCQFLITLVLARLLTPSDYGLVGMLAVFLAVAQSLIDSGFSQALIRKNDRTEIDNNTIFYFNVIASIVIYLNLFLIAPYVALFFKESSLCILLRVLGVVVIINGLSIVQRTIFLIEINFKEQTKATLIAAVLSGGIGIYAAYLGYGVWALVIQQISNATISTLLLCFFSKWRPKLLFSWASFQTMFRFGSKLLLSGLINTLYSNIYQLTIGKFFNATSLGYYSRAQQFAQLPSGSITDVLQRVVYPVLCKIQDDTSRYYEVSVRFIRVSAFVVFPIMCLLAGISKPLIVILIGEKWLHSAELLIPLCFTAMLLPLHALNLNAITVIGRSDLFLKLEIYKKIIGIIILVLTIPFGVKLMCYGSIVGSALGLILNSRYTGKEMGYGLISQIRDVAPVFLLSMIIFVQAYLISIYIDNNWLSLILSCLIGGLLFVGCSYGFKLKEIEYIKSLLK